MKTIKKCETCGREFEGHHAQKYCCDDCKRTRRNEAQKKSNQKRREREKRQTAATQRRFERAARHEEKPAPDTAPAARRKPVVLGNKMTIAEAVKALKEYNKKHGTNLSYGYAVAKGII